MSHVVPDLVQKVLKGQDPLHILGDGRQVRHYTYGGDLARGIRLAIEHPRRSTKTSTSRPRRSTTVLELAELIWRKIHGDRRAVPLVIDQPFAYDVRCGSRRSRRPGRLLGFEATTTLDEMLDEVIPWIAESRPRRSSSDAGASRSARRPGVQRGRAFARLLGETALQSPSRSRCTSSTTSTATPTVPVVARRRAATRPVAPARPAQRPRSRVVNAIAAAAAVRTGPRWSSWRTLRRPDDRSRMLGSTAPLSIVCPSRYHARRPAGRRPARERSEPPRRPVAPLVRRLPDARRHQQLPLLDAALSTSSASRAPAASSWPSSSPSRPSAAARRSPRSHHVARPDRRREPLPATPVGFRSYLRW